MGKLEGSENKKFPRENEFKVGQTGSNFAQKQEQKPPQNDGPSVLMLALVVLSVAAGVHFLNKSIMGRPGGT